MGQQIILVGGGHAHLRIVSQADDFHAAGVELILVDPGMFWYSGMATGMLGGRYSPEQDTIRLQDLCDRNGVAFRQTRAVALDRHRKELQTEAGETIPYDLLSLNVGSAVDTNGIQDPQATAWAVKPIPKLAELRQVLEGRVRAGRSCRVGIVGGGPAGIEIAANAEALCRDAGGKPAVTLLHRGEHLAPGFPPDAGRKLQEILADRGIEVRCGVRAVAVTRRGAAVAVRTGDDRTLAFDQVVLATGLIASPTVAALGLGPDGMAVDRYLRYVEDRAVFGAGDCILFTPRTLPKVGVFGVRQAPVLQRNLLAAIHGTDFEAYEPQDKFLLILNLGDGTGLAVRGNWYWHGRLAWLVKNFIDRRFMNQYRH